MQKVYTTFTDEYVNLYLQAAMPSTQKGKPDVQLYDLNSLQANVLNKLISQYKETKTDFLDTFLFSALEEQVLKELEAMNYIVIKRNIISSVSLTHKSLSLI